MRRCPPLLGEKKVLFIKVKSTLDALWRIAGSNRRKSTARVIGITGSNGKTTTKEFLYKILKSRHETIASEASFNNHIGVPLTLLKISPGTRYAVIEMGMNHKNELKNLTHMAMPDVTVVTNVAESHMEFFKNKREVAAAKAEIFLGLQENGYAVLNRDSAYFSVLRQKVHKRTLTFGSHPHATYRISEIMQKGSGYSFLFGKKGKVSRYLLSIPGFHNIYNAAASVSVCLEEGMPAEAVKKELTKVRLPKMRMEMRRTSGGVTVINDARYNANPFSTENAIKTLSGMETGGSRVMVFVDTLELGERAEMYHRKIGRIAARGISIICCASGTMRVLRARVSMKTRETAGKPFFFRENKIVGKLNEIMKKGKISLCQGFPRHEAGRNSQRHTLKDREMLYHFFYPLREYFFGFNVFKHITFRAALAALTAMVPHTPPLRALCHQEAV